MHTTLTIPAAAALFGFMVVLALTPSVSVLTVAARAAGSGLAAGLWTAAGVVAGDLIFILIAVTGLAAIAESAGALFTAIQYLGGAYLLWLSITMWRSPSRAVTPGQTRSTSAASSFLAGLTLTLADHKAILFYLGFFPAFVDLPRLSGLDVILIAAITIGAVGGAKSVYAYLATRTRFVIPEKTHHLLDRLAASAILVIALLILTRAAIA